MLQVSHLLPLVVSASKELLALQYGAATAPCPLALYRRASGQVPACRCMFPRKGRRLLDQQWREHMQTMHGDDLRILLNLVQDLFHTCSVDGKGSMSCPLGCKQPIQPMSAPPGAQARAEAADASPGAASPERHPPQVYLTAGALEATEGLDAAQLPALSLCKHLVSEHLLELQVLAALLDVLCLRAYNGRRCPFKALEPRACPGLDTSLKKTQTGSRRAAAKADVETKHTRTGATDREEERGTDEAGSHKHTPSMSPATRSFLSTPRPSSSGTPKSTAQGDGAGSGEGEVAPRDTNWWEHIRGPHLRDCIATVKALLERCEEAAGAAADALSPRLCCDVPGCRVHYQAALDLACHFLGHLRPRHPRLDESKFLLVTAEMAAGQAKSKGRGKAPGQKPGQGAAKGSAPLVCPFGSRLDADAESAGVRPCRFPLASREALEAHAFEEHWWQLEALGTCLSKIARCHLPSGCHVCPIRILGSEEPRARDGQGGGAADGEQSGSHLINQGRFGTSRALERHMQVHHIDSLSIMAAFANGLLAAGPANTTATSAIAVATAAAAGARCLLCEDSGPAEATSRVHKVLAGPFIAGPAHMLQHLGEVHPRRLIQVLHCLQMLTVHLPAAAPACPLGCQHTNQGDSLALMMHMAESHARQLLELSYLAAAESPVPIALSWGRIGKTEQAEDTRRTWAVQDKAVQAQVITGDQMTESFLKLLFGRKSVVAPPPPPPPPPPPQPLHDQASSKPKHKSAPDDSPLVSGFDHVSIVQQADAFIAKIDDSMPPATKDSALSFHLQRLRGYQQYARDFTAPVHAFKDHLSHVAETKVPEAASELGLPNLPKLLAAVASRSSKDLKQLEWTLKGVQRVIQKDREIVARLDGSLQQLLASLPVPAAAQDGSSGVMDNEGLVMLHHTNNVLARLSSGPGMAAAEARANLVLHQAHLHTLTDIKDKVMEQLERFSSEMLKMTDAELQAAAQRLQLPADSTREQIVAAMSRSPDRAQQLSTEKGLLAHAEDAADKCRQVIDMLENILAKEEDRIPDHASNIVAAGGQGGGMHNGGGQGRGMQHGGGQGGGMQQGGDPGRGGGPGAGMQQGGDPGRGGGPGAGRQQGGDPGRGGGPGAGMQQGGDQGRGGGPGGGMQQGGDQGRGGGPGAGMQQGGDLGRGGGPGGGMQQGSGQGGGMQQGGGQGGRMHQELDDDEEIQHRGRERGAAAGGRPRSPGSDMDAEGGAGDGQAAGGGNRAGDGRNEMGYSAPVSPGLANNTRSESAAGTGAGAEIGTAAEAGRQVGIKAGTGAETEAGAGARARTGAGADGFDGPDPPVSAVDRFAPMPAAEDDDVLLRTIPDASVMAGMDQQSMLGTVESMIMPDVLSDDVTGGLLGGDGKVRRLGEDAALDASQGAGTPGARGTSRYG